MKLPGWHEWVNTFPNNPTQNRYTRFMRKPDAESDFDKRMSAFAAGRDKWKKPLDNPWKAVLS